MANKKKLQKAMSLCRDFRLLDKELKNEMWRKGDLEYDIDSLHDDIEQILMEEVEQLSREINSVLLGDIFDEDEYSNALAEARLHERRIELQAKLSEELESLVIKTVNIAQIRLKQLTVRDEVLKLLKEAGVQDV